MKRIITLVLLLIAICGLQYCYAQEQNRQPSRSLTAEERVYGSWETDYINDLDVSYSLLVTPHSFVVLSAEKTFNNYHVKTQKAGLIGVDYTINPSISGDFSMESGVLSINNPSFSCPIHINGIHCKPSIAELLYDDIMSRLQNKVSLTDDADIMRKYGFNTPCKVNDYSLTLYIDGESYLFKRTTYLTSEKQVYTLGETINFTLQHSGHTVDPNECAFLELLRYNEAGECEMASFNDVPEKPGIYRYIAMDELYTSNMLLIEVVPSLQLNVSGYEAKKERHRRVIHTKTDSTLVADRYLQLSDTKVRIMPNDSASFKVINNGEDVTKESQISYIMRGQLHPLSNNIFKNWNTSYDFTAEYNGMQTPYCNVEVANPVILHIKQDTVEIGEAFRYLTYYYDTANPNNLEMFVEGSELRDKRDRVVARDGRMFYHTSAGTYRYYANDDKVRSDYDSIVVVEPDPIVLTIDTCKRDMRTLRSGIYLIEIDGHPIRFRVIQNGKDVTDKSKIYDAEGNQVKRFHYIYKPGFYRFYATHGYNNKSEVIVVEAHEKLRIYYDRIKYKDTDSVILTAKQDGIDVTKQCKFYHKYWRDNKGHELIGWSHDLSSAEEGLHTYWAIRDDFYESYKALVFHHPRKKGSGRKTLTVKADRDTIILGDSVMVTSLLNGKPTEATIYANGEPLMSQYYTPQSIGQSVFVAYKDKLTSDEEFVVVIPEEESVEEPTAEEPNDEAPEVPGGGEYGTGYLPQQSWVGTYSVTTPQKLVFDADGNISLVDDPETFEITITKEGHYRIYGLSKDNPEADVIALELGDDALAFNGSYFRTSSHADTIIRVDSTLTSKPQVDTLLVGKNDVEPMWVYTMQLTDGDADNAVMSYRHYVNPRFTIPYILTRDEAGRMTCTVAMPNCGDMQCKMVSVELFDVDKSSNTIRHRKPEGVKSYRAGGLTNIRKTSSVAKPIERTDSMLQHRSLLLLTPRQAIDEGMMFEPKADAGL